ncbi:hypothetical protein MBLNU13_g11023t1 [Cladosporium sp. NU13]
MAPKRKRSDKKGTPEPETPVPAETGALDADLTFDHLYDALNYNPSIDGPEDLEEYRRAWQLRRDLAELSRRPEGYFFTWRASDGRIYGAPLLTPPDIEAVQREDATFSPMPYTEQWYRDYLQHFGLPNYFLRDGHLVMVYDDLETKRLAMTNAPSPQFAAIPPRNYLKLRFSAAPRWPRLDRNGTYRLELRTEGARTSLMHYFPALSISEFPYRTYVLPSGRIQLRSMTETESPDMPIRSETSVAWDRFEEGQVVPSAYHREIIGDHPFHHASQPRDVIIQSAIDRHAVINPTEDIPGQGRMAFLTQQDEELAYTSGYINDENAADPQLVNLARRNGELAVGTGPNAGPIVVFWPNEALRNPREQPEGPGAWRFLTSNGHSSNRGFAAINFGGSHGLPTYPTASQIRRLGQLFVEDGREDLTDMVDIVWVPGAQDNNPGEDPVLDGTVEAADEEVIPVRPTKKRKARRTSVSAPNVSSPPADDAAGGATAPLHPHHDPTNNNGVPGSMHDQTGDPLRAVYETAWSAGRWNTVDRSRVWLGKVEHHKLYSFSARGFAKWKHADDMDWNDPTWINRLNKHREQTHQRAKVWGKRRDTPRQDYTNEETRYVWDLVAEAEGSRPSTPLRDIAREFNARFGSRVMRNDTGIQSLIDRLRRMYKEHGRLVGRKSRGWKQQQTSKALRGETGALEASEGEQSGEEVEEDEEGEDDSDFEDEDEDEDAEAEYDDE